MPKIGEYVIRLDNKNVMPLDRAEHFIGRMYMVVRDHPVIAYYNRDELHMAMLKSYYRMATPTEIEGIGVINTNISVPRNMCTPVVGLTSVNRVYRVLERYGLATEDIKRSTFSKYIGIREGKPYKAMDSWVSLSSLDKIEQEQIKLLTNNSKNHVSKKGDVIQAESDTISRTEGQTIFIRTNRGPKVAIPL